ncbi:hypothetical protein L202_05301 [Cryptococcus amylolentus CBS 6039]|uniref:t-SNARE coiled-coil homology domain-containing protein n=2 Tax=Cryptococcus amylolentus TaxID=104669 RepID=A0A1E3HJY1_9TREE|nr:hypothetical protein L202_05301 [Cryptococcus amylolentus CBS 6039]ODN76657.1 hypothetical protein L202_05301 [Cryptococcus amylolentus CBS 6039]ODO04623.1 hypothetical protein I350_05231 [Cryptococcus amylolentus CBS 6273]
MSNLYQRNPTYASSSSNVLYPPSGPSSGRGTPYRPASSASQYSESPYGGGMASSGSGYTPATHDVEGQNDERLDGLLGKVKILKDITKGIGEEVRDSNLQLGNMNDSFASATTLLSGTFKRMTKMATRQGGNWCWFMLFLLFVLFIFIVLWMVRR